MKTQKIFLAICFMVFASCSSKPVPIVLDTATEAQSTLSPQITSTFAVQSANTDLTQTTTPPPFDGAPQIWAMTFDEASNLWIATKTDLIKLDMHTWQYSRYRYETLFARSSDDRVMSLAIDPEGGVLILSRFGKVQKFKNGVWTTIIDQNTYLMGGGLQKQIDGSVLIEMGYLGAFKYDGKSLDFVQVPKQFSCGFSSVLEGNDGLWAIDGKCMKQPPLLRKYNNGDWTELKGYSPTEIIKDNAGNIWFWDDKYGLIRADLSEKIDLPAKLYFSYSITLAFAPDNSIWFFDNQYGVYHYSNKQWELVDVSFPTNRSTCLVVAPNGAVFLGTNGYGLLKLEKSQWSQTLFIQ